MDSKTLCSAISVLLVWVLVMASAYGADAVTVNSSSAVIDKAATVNGALTVTDQTDSSSPTSGAVKVTGGIGVAKNLNVGANASITGTLTVGGQISTPVYQFRTHGVMTLNTNNTYKVIPFSTTIQETTSSDFNSSTGVFTAPEDGLYAVNLMAQMKPISTTHYFILLIETSADSGNTWSPVDSISEHQVISGPYESASIAVYWAMDAGDLIRCQIKHSNTGASRDMNKARLNIARIGNK